ncbi:MAG: hypothetical protein JWO44_1013 [Bacteroidetes bacterium]|nr:hypothetical protein [Bacteroidota bacterium]
MKGKNSIWLNLVFLLLGAWFSYIFCQYKYLEIDTKINISTSLISITTAMIALYLAISLKKNQTQTSNLHNYLQPKLDIAWKLFLNISHELSLKDQIELSEVTKSIKEINQNITPLKKTFSSFGLDIQSIEVLETAIENLENFLVDECPIENNIIKLSDKKTDIVAKLDLTHTFFANALKAINKIS